MIIKLIFSQKASHGRYFEYPCYGVLTQRKFFRGISISDNTSKNAIFGHFELWVPIWNFDKKTIFPPFSDIQNSLETSFLPKMCDYRYSKCSPWITLSNELFFMMIEDVGKNFHWNNRISCIIWWWLFKIPSSNFPNKISENQSGAFFLTLHEKCSISTKFWYKPC